MGTWGRGSDLDWRMTSRDFTVLGYVVGSQKVVGTEM